MSNWFQVHLNLMLLHMMWTCPAEGQVREPRFQRLKQSFLLNGYSHHEILDYYNLELTDHLAKISSKILFLLWRFIIVITVSIP